ncbi:MAG: hypothetical protein JO279_02630 [Verrucomicrobia bacterium]|nr:hypothetical protein [Verrucomicrobiota bacterium]
MKWHIAGPVNLSGNGYAGLVWQNSRTVRANSFAWGWRLFYCPRAARSPAKSILAPHEYRRAAGSRRRIQAVEPGYLCWTTAPLPTALARLA